jgi:peroxiredoxin
MPFRLSALPPFHSFFFLPFCRSSVLPFMFLPFLGLSQIGDPAPDFTVTDTDGNTHRLYDYVESGKVVVLDFYYTTCGPCQFYSPQVNLAYEKYGCNTANVIFLSIDYNDTDAEVEAYDNTYAIEFPSISGTQGGGNAVVSQYGIFGFPTFYVIDSSKTIIETIDPPTLQVFDFRFQQHGILPASCTTSLEETTFSSQLLTLFPNPASSAEVISTLLPTTIAGLWHYEIFDYTGKLATSRTSVVDKGGYLEISADHLLSGLYRVHAWPDQLSNDYYSVLMIK